MRRAVSALVVMGIASMAGCNDHDNGSGSTTTTSVARSEIAQSTTESAVPIAINDLPFDDRDTNETATPMPVD